MRGTSMARQMWTLLVFPALFHLLQAHRFGDILSVKRLSFLGRPLYIHFAIYVGLGPVNGLQGKLDNQDIFHLNSGFPACQFGTMGNTAFELNNYLDNQAQTQAQMIAQMNALRTNTLIWLPWRNCEHMATTVRYGVAVCQQNNTWVQVFMQKYQRILDRIRNAGKRSVPFSFEHGLSLAAAGA